MLQVLVFLVKGPAAVACRAAGSVQVAVGTLWQGAKPLGQFARSASGLVRASSLAATTSGASMTDLGQQASALPSLDVLARRCLIDSSAYTKDFTAGQTGRRVFVSPMRLWQSPCQHSSSGCIHCLQFWCMLLGRLGHTYYVPSIGWQTCKYK